MRRKLSFLLFAFLCSLCVSAQSVIKGVVIDKDTQEPLIGVSVFSDVAKIGTSTNLDGIFELKVPSIGGNLTFTYIGYKTLEMKASANMGFVELASDAVGLSDVVVTSSVAIRRKTPVAISVVGPEMLETKLSTQEFPEILKSTPGVYATKKGGGFGDSRVNMRGFENENIAVMINGVPMNDMEWGGVYWSNLGLTDVTRSTQVQRGLGASKVSAPSVGGSINIVTKSIDAEKGGNVSYAVGNDGYNKLLFTTSTGITENGWAVTLLGSKTWGDGYFQGGDFEGYTYFLNVSKRINDNNFLSYTLFGSPQWHYTRKDDLLISVWQKQDEKYRYNASYGFDMNGQRKKGTGYNKSHKPQMSLNHSWTINDKSSLSTSLYYSKADAYGLTGQGLTSADRNKWYATTNTGEISGFRSADGTFDYGAVYAINKASVNGSEMATARSINSHDWYGLMSTYTTRLGEYIELYGGIDLRYYKGAHKAKLYDLYGGDYFIDKTSRANVQYQKGNTEWINQKLRVGDIVYRNYDGYVVQYGTFGQAEYNKDKLATFVAASINNNSYWRKDYFYYDAANRKSDTKSFVGFTIKGGANYNIDSKNNVFANVGYISRAPFFSGGVFLQAETSNYLNKDAKNEKIFSFELGYGYRSQIFAANVNVYHTKWSDKTMTKSLTLADNGRGTLNLTGVNALHKGIEADFEVHPVKDLKITGMISFGDWTWDSNASGYAYNLEGQPLTADLEIASGIGAPDHALTHVNLKGVKVGNSAQTTFAVGANYKVLKDIRLGVDYTYYARNYAGYTLRGSDLAFGKENNYETPWRMPSAGQLDANMSYDFKVSGLKATMYANVNNLLNNTYISDAVDGKTHTAETAQVFYAFGRTYSVRLKLNF